MIDHTETDKAFDEKYKSKDGSYPMGLYMAENVKQFIHHRIELEVEKAIAKLKKDHYCCKYQTIDPKNFCDYCVGLNK